MEKRKLIVVSLIVFLIIIGIVAIVEFKNISDLKNRNNQLEEDRAQLSKDKEGLMVERDQLNSENQVLTSKMKMMEEDVNQIYRSCMTQNACKGRYPGIRWNCNNVGDTTDVNPSHICVCDSSCNLNATEIKKS